MWSGFNIWQLAKTDADRAAFTQRYGWDAATSYIDSTDRVTKISYNGASLKRNELNTGGINRPAHHSRAGRQGPGTCGVLQARWRGHGLRLGRPVRYQLLPLGGQLLGLTFIRGDPPDLPR